MSTCCRCHLLTVYAGKLDGKNCLREKDLFQIGGDKTTQNRLYATLHSHVWKKTHCSFVDRYQRKSTFSSVSLCVENCGGCFFSKPMNEGRKGLASLLLLGGYSDFTGNWEDFSPLLWNGGSSFWWLPTFCSCMTLYLHWCSQDTLNLRSSCHV